MAEKQINGRIIHKHDTEANWNKATNFIPKNGEIIIYDPDSNYSYARVKVGDGTTKVTSLPFIDNVIQTAQTQLSDNIDLVRNNSITALSVSGRTITYTKGSGATGTITTQDNNTTYSAGTGLSLSGTTFNHKNSITAATAQGSASKTLAFGDTFTIPTITYDAQGHITSKGTTTMTMPAGPVAKEGNPVSEIGIEGAGLDVKTTFEPKQEGSGDPSPDNVRSITGWTGAKLTRCGKNLLPNNSSTHTTSGITFTVNGDGSITANGTATANAIFTFVSSTSNPELRNALLGKQVTLSGCPSGGSSKTYDLRIYQYADANSYLMDYGSSKTATFTNAELPFNIAILIRSGVKVNNLVFRPQIELGSTATAYEPYQGDTFTADFGQTVYGGTLDWQTGILTVDRAMKSFTGEEYWEKSSATTSDRFISPVSGALAGTEVVCSHGNGEGNLNDLNHCYITASSNFAWNYSSHGSTTVDAFKSYLTAQNTAGTPVQVCYKLATPQIIQLTPQDLRMLDGINNVYSDGITNYVIFNSGASSLAQVDKNYLKLTGGTLTGYLILQNNATYPRLLFKSSSYDGSQGEMFYRILNDEASSNFLFRQYCRSSKDYSLLSTYEDFKLPQTTADRTSSGYYDILTTKSAVTIAQGGTGATTASGARTNLEVPSKTGDGASGTWGINITGSSNKISYSTQLTTDDAINAFNTGSTFQVSTWNNTSSPGVSNGILINAGWTSSAYGVQIAIDDDPTYYIALRQKDNNGWNAWKRIPMGDGTGASGTWGISITGNAATATKLATAHTLTIGNTGKTFDGSGNVSWSLSEIGAAASSHTHSYLPLSGGTLSGTLTMKNSDKYPRMDFKSTSYSGDQGRIYYSIEPNNTTSHFFFRTYSRSSTDYSLISYYEDYKLPSTTADRTSSASYTILTTKSTVTVAQGGTGASTAAGARKNLGAYPQADMVFTTDGSEQTTSIKFDGKTVYRKTYSIGSISANGTKQIDTGLTTTIDIIFNLRGVARLAESQYRIPLPYASNQSGYNYQLQMVGVGTTPKINITAGTAAIASGFVILEYTKL